MRMTELERITAVETRLTALEDKIDNIDKKLDDLVQLKYKGMGAFWLVGLIISSGVIGLFIKLFHLFGAK